MSGPDDGELLRRDTQARADALDVARSFLVQAPAGSGKTELLIQRLLALLARVDEPERILALTFTRKAAGEMRKRVLDALREARDRTPLDNAKPHLVATRALAEAALAQDRARGWALTEHPSRLRIVTFDALTTWIVRSAPLSAALGPAPDYAEDAKALFATAAAQAIADAREDDRHWRRLLLHVRNDADRLADLLARLLAKRDQLLHVIGVGNTPEAVQRALIDALEDEAKAELAALQRAFPRDLAPDIAPLARMAADALAADAARADFAQCLGRCADCAGIPPFTIEAMPLWSALGEWLLTNEGTPRRAVTVAQGFAAAGTGPGKDHRVAAKRAMAELVGRIAGVPGLAGILHGVATMPAPIVPEPQAWEVVEALLAVFPGVEGHLRHAFARERRVDFTQASLGALEALGKPDAPSDLLQRIDYRLAHLLVDEFQDTSATQLEVLERLTAGWTPGEDGRTLFAVGDPMQSIYRFREAEVRLFVEAWQEREVAGVPVERLTLRRNFRAQKALVDWVNATFAAVLGRVNDPVRGAVRFEPATATHAVLGGEGCTLELHVDTAVEAQAVVARVQAALRSGSDDIAILVRARRHLDAVLPALREAGIEFAAVELDKLGQRQAVQDLASLAHALLQPGDRLAWLAVLRAPWCGLALADLLAVAAAAPPPVPIVAVLDDPACLDALSADGRTRLTRIRPILAAARASHGRAGVVARVRGAWLALGGPASLADALDLGSADSFFEVLAAHEHAGDVPDWDAFRNALDELRASSEATAKVAVRVMTMHKAKGLEFDTVILPGLGRKDPGVSHELLRWRSRGRGLLIAPSKAPGGTDTPVYAYLKALEKEETEAELGRLLYVACTRAKSRLHLLAAPPVGEDKQGSLEWRPPSTSSLARLWPVLAERAPPPLKAPADAAAPANALPLLRLPDAFAPRLPDAGLPALPVAVEVARHEVPFDWAQERARVVGTLAHRLLARLGDGGAWDEARLAALLPRVRADLAGAGFAGDEVEPAAARVLDVVRRTLADERGRWIFAARHEESRSEWGIAGVDGGAIVHVVLDRAFVEAGVRWIVDFKTGVHEGGDAETFLASEAERYAPQLRQYGRLVQAMEGRPVRLALYHPLVAGGFREIAPG